MYELWVGSVWWSKRASEKRDVSPSRAVEEHGHLFVYAVNLAVQYSPGQGVSAYKCSGSLIKTSLLCCFQTTDLMFRYIDYEKSLVLRVLYYVGVNMVLSHFSRVGNRWSKNQASIKH